MKRYYYISTGEYSDCVTHAYYSHKLLTYQDFKDAEREYIDLKRLYEFKCEEYQSGGPENSPRPLNRTELWESMGLCDRKDWIARKLGLTPIKYSAGIGLGYCYDDPFN